MKKFLFITLLALFCSVSGYAQEHTELLESAKEKFAAGEYKSAELKLDTYIDLSGDASQSSLMTNIKMCLNILEKAEAEREANGFSDEAREYYQMILEYNPADANVNKILADWPTPVEGATYVEETNGLNMKMIFVEGGTFMMGADDVIKDEGLNAALQDAHPKHEVTLSSYYIGETEVTQRQWNIIMGTTIHDLSAEAKRPVNSVGDNIPIYYVTWEQASQFCEKLSQLTGKKYVLPTEAQWEFAARGGNKSRGGVYSGGNTMNGLGWTEENSGKKVYPVAQAFRNDLDIYDMSGNVQEWCSDWYENRYQPGAQTDPQGPAWSNTKVYRGGDYQNGQNRARVEHRLHDRPFEQSESNKRTVGFRVACLID